MSAVRVEIKGVCVTCGATEDLFLHQGQMYCLECLPLEEFRPGRQVELLAERLKRRRERLREEAPRHQAWFASRGQRSDF